MGQVTVFAYFLWSLFWVQFLVMVFYGVPKVSDSNQGLLLYLRLPGQSYNLAELFFVVSLVAAVVTVVSAWVVTGESHGKWRQRFLVLLFCVPPVGLAEFQMQRKEGVVNNAQAWIDWARDNETIQSWDYEIFLKPRVERLEELMEKVRSE